METKAFGGEVDFNQLQPYSQVAAYEKYTSIIMVAYQVDEGGHVIKGSTRYIIERVIGNFGGSIFAYRLSQALESSKAKAIIAGTESGFTARFLAQPRPHVPILMLTDNATVTRQMLMLWGVTPLQVTKFKKVLSFLEDAIKYAKKINVVKKGDRVVLVTGNPTGRRVNLVEAQTVR